LPVHFEVDLLRRGEAHGKARTGAGRLLDGDSRRCDAGGRDIEPIDVRLRVGVFPCLRAAWEETDELEGEATVARMAGRPLQVNRNVLTPQRQPEPVDLSVGGREAGLRKGRVGDLVDAVPVDQDLDEGVD